MIAELIAVGSELLLFGRRDTNGDWLTERLQRLGLRVGARVTVPDDEERIAAAVSAAVGHAELVLLTGGLGPTEDDRTREGLARAVGRPLVRDDERAEWLRRAFEVRGLRFRPMQLKQAERPEGSQWIDNPLGSAAGLLVRSGDTLVAALPGVPAEMRAMFEAGVVPALGVARGPAVARRTLRVAGRFEASVDEQLRSLYGSPGVTVTILGGREGIELHLMAEGSSAAEAQERLAGVASRMAERLGDDLYGRDDESLPAAVGVALGRAGLTVATAESCTAGLIGGALTAVAGSSAWYRGGFVIYADDLKTELVGVPGELLATHGAVSEPVARALAEGARLRCTADLGLGVTGIAGPGGGTPDKPIGLVHVALADERATAHWRLRLVGDRELIRRRAVVFALDRVRRRGLASVRR